MWVEKYLLLFSSFVSFLNIGHGQQTTCQMDGVTNWLLTQDADILDVYRGTFWSRNTSNIVEMGAITVGGSVNYGQYLDVKWDQSGLFTISTKAGYDKYEENEINQSISFTVNFICSDASTNSLIFEIQIIDTNNNPPIFKPNDQYEFTITPPLPPGFQITGCIGDDIVVRDIDLTTSAIDFTIEDNPYFEISFVGRSSMDHKEFIGSLKTKDLIRSLPEDLVLTISATDVDATSDPPLTTKATIRIKADENFLFPAELVFAQAFYTTSYTNNQVVLEQAISLQQGYDDQVTFSLEGEYSDHFELVPDGNRLSIQVKTALSNDVLRSSRIILVVRAEREYTSGATTTVIIQLPEVLGLEFEQMQYESRIVDNVLDTLQLTLKQGYEEGFNVTVKSEFDSYFTTTTQGNLITISMTPLTDQIINDNNFITLQVIASNEYSTAFTIVTLDIIKDDDVTPAFEKPIYSGEYNPDTGLTAEQITLGQGYDQTVSFFLSGVSSEYFTLSNVGPVISLLTTGIPIEVWSEQQLLLTVSAARPRKVTATTTVSIKLPKTRELAFAAPVYSGTLQDNTLTLGTIVLSTGFAEDVAFSLNGDYVSYFTLSPAPDGVTINLTTPLPDDVILENNFLSLTLSVSGSHAVPTSTTILIEIIKQDLTTPVFNENVYIGTYLRPNSIEIGSINLTQGYDDSVTFRLDGEHSQYFQVTNVENSLSLVLTSTIPPEVIFTEKVLVFNILAEKQLTVGANAAISIIFPSELTDTTIMEFSRNTYTGSLDNNTLKVENLVIETGYESGTTLSLSGDYASYFRLQNTENVITISVDNALPKEILINNNFIILEISASRERTVSVTASVVIDIIREEITFPTFSHAYYKTEYADGRLEDLTITLSEGFDETVTFELAGEASSWFTITNEGNIVRLALNATNENIPEDVLDKNDYFLFTIVASKPDIISARAAIFVHLPKEPPESVLVQFSQTSYVGRIESGELYPPAVTLLGELEPVHFNVIGEYAQYFEVSQISTTNVVIRLKNGLPTNIDEISFIILDIEAQYPKAISGHTTVILKVVKQPKIVLPVFEQAYYIGKYSEQEGLQFELSIRLSQGFDESVVFTLSGDDSQWFQLNNIAENNFTLIVSNNGLQQIKDRSHLVFIVVASKADNITGQAAVIISISDFTTTRPLNFERSFYKGSIENDVLKVENIILNEGYSPDIKIYFTGDYVEYFQLTNQEGIFTLQLQSELPANVTDYYNVLILSLEVQVEDIRTHTTVVLELIKTELTPLVFEETYYVGSYLIKGGFIFDPLIRLSEGYDETVSFSLEGEDSQWFKIIENQYPLTLSQINTIPNEVISNNNQLIFTIVADKPGGITARSIVIISIIDDTTVLEFARNVYFGTLQENSITTNIDTIVLSEGYSQNVVFNLQGDFENFFNITQEGAAVRVLLNSIIPSQLIPSNGIITLELAASAPESLSAQTTLVFGIIRREITSLQFDRFYYNGRYSESEGLQLLNNITLVEGFDDHVQFVLEGDDSKYFETVVIENAVSLFIVNKIPAEIIVNHRPLTFTIRADKTDATSAISTIVIALIDESEPTVLRFDQISYLGVIQNNTIEMVSISLTEGYSSNVTFSLRGDLEPYFSISSEEALLTIKLENPLPESIISNNSIIILELQASAPNAISAYAAIVFNVIKEEIAEERLEFSNFYYTGHYSESEGLVFNEELKLADGYDKTVNFVLEGDDSEYFEIVHKGNTLYLNLTTTIPAEVIVNRRQLIFTIRAEKLNFITTRATIVIALRDEIEPIILRFDKNTHLGTLENNTIELNSITLSEGYNQDITYRLQGELQSYFSFSSEETTVAIKLITPIPDSLIPSNGIIILELEASAPRAISAYATIIFNVVREEITEERLFFTNPYYSGHYTVANGLELNDDINLVQDLDESVQFILEGDDSQYFTIVTKENSLYLNLTTTIPVEVIVNRHLLIFTMRAEKPDAITARATIVIALVDERDTTVLRFDKNSYVGTMENNTLELDSITLSEGYNPDITYRLQGELQSYFSFSSEETTVAIKLKSPIPDSLIPSNGIIILELEASAPRAISAYTTIIFNVIREEITEERLFFTNPYYSGHYTVANGLELNDDINLVQGLDESVQFILEGDDSQYFTIVTKENSLYLNLTTTIPVEVIVNRRLLIFTMRAEKPDAITARAIIVIALVDERDTTVLRFDKNSYVGTMENNTLELESITLSEGYNSDITFYLQGDLQSYFSFSSEGGTVTIKLETSIPDNLIPTNGIVILELQASAPSAISAYTTIIFNVLRDEITERRLIFTNAYYTGYYTEAEGLAFNDEIRIVDGFDETVQFNLNGDDAQYFEIIMKENSISLILTTVIPTEVVINKQQLIFTISAKKPGAISSRATIVISLFSGLSDFTVLRFDQSLYLGSLQNDTLTVVSISLMEGDNHHAKFELNGDLSRYFNIFSTEASITLELNEAIPDNILPDNNLIILEVEASAANMISGRAAIVIEVVQKKLPAIIEQLLFGETYYTGSYTEVDGLLFESYITLTKGYDENVTFTLAGDSAQYFEVVVVSENSASLRLTKSIPSAIVTNNQQLIFTIRADKPDTISGRATIVISLYDEYREITPVLGFDRISYVGSIAGDVASLNPIILSEGYSDNVDFTLNGELQSFFTVTPNGPIVTVYLLSAIPEELVPSNNIITLELQASAPVFISAHAAIIYKVVHEPVIEMKFSNSYYTGNYTIESGLTLDSTIFLSQGYDNSVQFSLEGEQSKWFQLANSDSENSVSLLLIDTIAEDVLENNRKLIFIIVAQKSESSTRATIIISLVNEAVCNNYIWFEKVLYQGTVQDGEVQHETIRISGYDEKDIQLFGEHAESFSASLNEGVVTVQGVGAVTLPPDASFVALELRGGPASAVLLLDVIRAEVEDNAVFDKVLYEGIVQGGVVQHEIIAVSGYDGKDILIFGEYAALFSASLSEGVVTVRGVGSVTLSQDISFVALELRAGSASAALVLNVIHNENPELPSVTFSSPSYTFRASVTQTGVVGQVQATASNDEAVRFSLVTDNVHLLQRLTVNLSNGELTIWAPLLNTGVYNFEIRATTAFSQVSATAGVQLTVEIITLCKDDDYILPPLQILDRDEESPHDNIIPFDVIAYEGCSFSLNNHWPANQSWLYVNENGLQARAIDREDTSIAFMALSQIQVELVLVCDHDNELSRSKRSLNSELIANQLEHLGPYDYGQSKWILTDSILHNPRRSFINLIVNDINDNYPIFVGKQDEPIVVGYPVADLEERILPRALIEVEATDADVGENAALVYWSNETVLAVAPTSGSVHVRDIAGLTDGAVLTVYATDRNGQGLTGSLDLLIKLINTSHVAVVTVREAFVNDETKILTDLTAAVGYEVKALRSAVISDAVNVNLSRKREAIISTGASLQLYVYGLIEQELVDVKQLTDDISTSVIETVNVANTVSLEDYLENLVICPLPERDTALFVSTIVLAILLFILIVAAAVWFFLKWRKKQNYEEFSDANSLASRNESVPPVDIPKPEAPMPRINIEDLKRSEKRLQQMLDAPTEVVSGASTQKPEQLPESKVSFPELPLVIQSIDKLKDADESEDEDEFGERKKNRRKSVVTFNENVEKIIHVEDPPDDSEFEVYKL